MLLVCVEGSDFQDLIYEDLVHVREMEFEDLCGALRDALISSSHCARKWTSCKERKHAIQDLSWGIYRETYMLGKRSLCAVLGDNIQNTLLFLAQYSQLLPGTCLDIKSSYALMQGRLLAYFLSSKLRQLKMPFCPCWKLTGQQLIY